MIIIKYLMREILKSQFAILFILLIIFFCQKFLRIINAVTSGEIPTNLIINLLILELPKIAQLVFPLSLLLAILKVLNNFYDSNEIIAIYSCGFSKNILLISSIYLSLITIIFSIININWLLPLSSFYHEKITKQIKYDPKILMFSTGKFQILNNGNTIIFVEKFKNNHFNNVFLVQFSDKKNINPFIIFANYGKLEKYSRDSNLITINNGTIFEGKIEKNNFKITNFSKYQSIINNKKIIINNKDAKKSYFIDLLKNNSITFRAELHWRITITISIILMAMIAVPLSLFKKSYQGRILSLFIYLFFFLIQSTLKFKGIKGYIDPAIWMWVVNFIYLMLAITLNIWNNVTIRRLSYFYNFKLVN